jgi:hypothetical protein
MTGTQLLLACMKIVQKSSLCFVVATEEISLAGIDDQGMDF